MNQEEVLKIIEEAARDGRTELHLGGNNLTSVPAEIGQLTNLTELLLYHNKLTNLPAEIWQLKNLAVLGLSNNNLTSVPGEIGQLKNLTVLGLYHNKLTSLPAEIWQLKNLRGLNLGENKVASLPGEIGQLKNLTGLWLHGNSLTCVPGEIGQLKNLGVLSLASNNLTSVPAEIGQLKDLTELDLRSNKLTSLPAEIGQLKDLTELNLGGNSLTSVPAEIGQLRNLTELRLHDNHLTSLPAEIGQLKNLTMLYLDDNNLTSVPGEIRQLKELTLLGLGDNNLTSVPAEIGQLKGLTVLGLHHNNLTSLPAEIGQLKNLTELYLHNNNLTSLPAEIGQLKNLRELVLDDNPSLKEPPPEIVEQGTQAVLAYLRGLKKQELRKWISKLLIVGEGGVGKSHLLYALRGERPPEVLETTHGIEIEPLELPHPEEPGVEMTLNCWDFGGQQIYHATHQFFLTDKSLFLLVWNARVGYEQSKLYYWLDTIKALAPESPVLLVATHIDERDADLPYEDLKRKYPKIVGHWEVCCTSGEGVDGLAEAIGRAASALPLMGQAWPGAWLRACEAIRAKRPDNHITKAQLQEIMMQHDVECSGQAVLATWMHELGYILYFDEDDELKDTVLLDPEWVTNKISDVLECDAIIEGSGVFCQGHMDDVWRDVTDPVMRERLLRLMEKFDLSYRIPDDPQDRSLVVERLRLDPAGYQSRWDAILETTGCKEVGMKFDLQSTRPAGIPTWFIARAHRFTTSTHWRFGALFSDAPDHKHLALVVAPPSERYVTLTVRGPSPHNFLALLKDGLELTLRRFPGLDIKRTIPCPGHDSKKCKHEFDFRQLEGAIERDKPVLEVQCQETFENVPLAKLLFGLHWYMKDAILERLVELRQEMARDHNVMFSEQLKSFDGLKEGQIVLLTELQDLRELAQRGFTSSFNAMQRLEESACPNVFVILPVGSESWQKRNIFGQKMGLQLYCHKPGHWHPTYSGGHYEIRQPGQWLKVMSPYIVKLAKLIKYAAPLAGPAAGMASAAFAEQFKHQLKMMEELAKKLGDESEISGAELVEGIGKTGRLEQAEGAPLRALRTLLDKVDPKHYWGGLKKILTPEGHYLWLCDEHAKEYRI